MEKEDYFTNEELFILCLMTRLIDSYPDLWKKVREWGEKEND